MKINKVMEQGRIRMTLGSLFDGIGGFPLAAGKVGINIVWTSEIEKHCVDITKRHFPGAEQLGDITRLCGASLAPVDIISFGSPCQNLSIAGNRKGLEGEESRLFYEAVRIIDEMRIATNGRYPKYIIWENVEGAFSSNKGQDFKRVLEEITKTSVSMPDSGRWAGAGMVRDSGGCTAWRRMDAQYWGVPQRRKRIYLVRSFGNERAGRVLFEREEMLAGIAKDRGYGTGHARGTEDSIAGNDSGRMEQDESGQIRLQLQECHPTVYTINGNVVGRKRGNGGNAGGFGKNVLPTLTTKGNHVVAVMRREGRREKCRPRYMTPLECERVDGFPDDWTRLGASGKEIPKSARMKALGNSIAIPCAVRVFAGIVLTETEEDCPNQTYEK